MKGIWLESEWQGGRNTGAVFSPCKKYRYTLWRLWADSPPAMFLLLNPSTADEVKNDPTVERCERRARAMGFGGLVVCNLFAIRATDPRVMKRDLAPVGPENDRSILEHARQAGMVIAGWGTHGAHLRRGELVRHLLKSNGIALHCLELTKEGHPKHPLYVGYDRLPVRWE
jgi:hypothetical protein